MPLNFSLLFFIYLESNAVILHKFWRPQPTLPWLGLQYSITKKTRTTVSLSSMKGGFAESSLRKQTWRNHKEGRVGCLHQNILTMKVIDLPPTYHSHPASLYLTSRVAVPLVLASHTWRPQVPHLAFPSPQTRVPVSSSQFYTQPISEEYG